MGFDGLNLKLIISQIKTYTFGLRLIKTLSKIQIKISFLNLILSLPCWTHFLHYRYSIYEMSKLTKFDQFFSLGFKFLKSL